MTLDPAILAVFGEPPSGIDLAAETSRQDLIIVVILAVLALISISGRVWARTIRGVPLWMDDFLILFAMFLVTLSTIMAILGGHFGSGRHVWAITMDDFTVIFKILYGYTFIYGTSAAAVKLSFLYCYVRVFITGSRRSVFYCQNARSVAICLGIFLSLAYPITIWITMLSACKPIHYFWSQYTDPTGGTCINTPLFFWVAAFINMIIDIYILLIPIPLVMKLQMQLLDRLLLVGIFLLGGFVCIASGMRIHYLRILRTTHDPTWAMGPVFIWSAIEPALSIVSSCLINYRPIVQYIWRRLSGKVSKSGTDASGSYVTESTQRSRRRTKGDDDELALVTITGNTGPQSVSKDAGIYTTREVTQEFGARRASTNTPISNYNAPPGVVVQESWNP